MLKYMMDSSQTIDDVKQFWNKNPLLTGEITEEVGTLEWFQLFDEIKSSVFLNDLSGFFLPRMLLRGKPFWTLTVDRDSETDVLQGLTWSTGESTLVK